MCNNTGDVAIGRNLKALGYDREKPMFGRPWPARGIEVGLWIKMRSISTGKRFIYVVNRSNSARVSLHRWNAGTIRLGEELCMRYVTI